MTPPSKILAMLGWSIIASAWRSASKRAITCFVSIPGLMTFRATLRRTGCSLLGDVDDAHAPLADLLHQLVGADDRAGPLHDEFVDGCTGLGGRGHVEALLAAVGPEKFLDPLPQRGVLAAGLVQVRRPLLGRVALDGGEEDRLDPGDVADHDHLRRNRLRRSMRRTRPAILTRRKKSERGRDCAAHPSADTGYNAVNAEPCRFQEKPR